MQVGDDPRQGGTNRGGVKRGRQHHQGEARQNAAQGPGRREAHSGRRGRSGRSRSGTWERHRRASFVRSSDPLATQRSVTAGACPYPAPASHVADRGIQCLTPRSANWHYSALDTAWAHDSQDPSMDPIHPGTPRAQEDPDPPRAVLAPQCELFVERGYAATTADDIAAAANVSRRTFFRYFARKEEVFIVDPERQACGPCTWPSPKGAGADDRGPASRNCGSRRGRTSSQSSSRAEARVALREPVGGWRPGSPTRCAGKMRWPRKLRRTWGSTRAGIRDRGSWRTPRSRSCGAGVPQWVQGDCEGDPAEVVAADLRPGDPRPWRLCLPCPWTSRPLDGGDPRTSRRQGPDGAAAGRRPPRAASLSVPPRRSARITKGGGGRRPTALSETTMEPAIDPYLEARPC